MQRTPNILRMILIHKFGLQIRFNLGTNNTMLTQLLSFRFINTFLVWFSCLIHQWLFALYCGRFIVCKQFLYVVQPLLNAEVLQ